MYLTKYMGLSCPHHFLKSRGSVIRNNFLEYRTKQVNNFVQRDAFYTLFARNKAKHIFYRHISCSFSVTIYSKSIKKNHKKSFF